MTMQALKYSGSANYAAHVGEAIVGNLMRGQHGRFASAGAAVAANPAAVARVFQTMEQLAKQGQGSALNPKAMQALLALAQKQAADPDMLKAIADETGLVHVSRMGKASLSKAGSAMLKAMAAGDVHGAMAALEAGRTIGHHHAARHAARTARAHERLSRAHAREQRQTPAHSGKPSAGTGGHAAGHSGQHSASQGHAGSGQREADHARHEAEHEADRQARNSRTAEHDKEHAADRAAREQRQQQHDQQREGDRQARAAERQQRETERQARQAARDKERQMRDAARQAKQGKGGGGHGGKPAKPAEFTPELASAAAALSAGKDLTPEQAKALTTNGLAIRLKDGSYRMTAAGRRAAKQGQPHTTKAEDVDPEMVVSTNDEPDDDSDLDLEEEADDAEQAEDDAAEADEDEDDAMDLTTEQATGGVVKALDTNPDAWELDVLAVPYGGPVGGKDAHGEYFSPSTKFYEDHARTVPVLYYHGYDPATNQPAGEPEFIGTATWQKRDDKGGWMRATLNRASASAGKVWEAAKRQAAVASTGAIAHLKRVQRDGHITHWPIAELSIWDGDNPYGRKQANTYAVALPAMKSVYLKAGLALPDLDTTHEPTGDQQAAGDAATDAMATATVKSASPGDTNVGITAEELEKLLDARDARQAEEATKRAEAEKAVQDKIDAAIKTALDKQAQEFARANRLPYADGDVSVPVSLKFGYTRKYDTMDAVDLSLFCELQGALKGQKIGDGKEGQGASETALKALILKAEEDKSEHAQRMDHQLKALGIKANEVNNTGLTSFGTEWVGTAYSSNIWYVIRLQSIVGQRLMASAVEFPAGYNTMVLPLESADPVFYKVAETTSVNATTLRPDATVPSSQEGTAKNSMTLAKMGARIIWSGEMDEDSLIPWVPELRRKLEVVGAEYFSSAIIDGDTATAGTTNINDIGNGSAQAANVYYALFNGFRKLALVTNTANSRAGAVLSTNDYLETVKLMGSAGINALDTSKVSFLVDPLTRFKTSQQLDVKDGDQYGSPTLDKGLVNSLWGYSIELDTGLAYKSANRLTNTAGKVDQTTAANNTKGEILAVRWDQWKLGFRRRMSIETQRIPDADSTQIVCFMRVGLNNRDAEAAALTYNLTV
jgi:hypothetical protein